MMEYILFAETLRMGFVYASLTIECQIWWKRSRWNPHYFTSCKPCKVWFAQVAIPSKETQWGRPVPAKLFSLSPIDWRCLEWGGLMWRCWKLLNYENERKPKLSSYLRLTQHFAPKSLNSWVCIVVFLLTISYNNNIIFTPFSDLCLINKPVSYK